MPWKNTPEARRASNEAYGPEYRRNRPLAMKRDRWRCRIRIEGVCIGAASTCDHIVGVAEGGGHSLSNLRAACDPCHKKRTAEQGGGYRNGSSSTDPEPKPRTNW